MEVSCLALNTGYFCQETDLNSIKKKNNVSERTRHVSTEQFVIINYKLVLTNFAS